MKSFAVIVYNGLVIFKMFVFNNYDDAFGKYHDLSEHYLRNKSGEVIDFNGLNVTIKYKNGTGFSKVNIAIKKVSNV